MCDGSKQPISTLEEGDLVLSKNEQTGQVSCEPVRSPYVNPNRVIYELKTRNENGETSLIETTDNHPFYVNGSGWTRVDELQIGDLIDAKDSILEVVQIIKTDRIEDVYNFEVDSNHTCFVGEAEAWVHNCDVAKNIRALRKWAKSKGYKRVQKLTDAKPERWDNPLTGKYGLKIKTKKADFGKSTDPRFEAKVGDGQWVNPFNGKRGGKELSHESLGESYF